MHPKEMLLNKKKTQSILSNMGEHRHQGAKNMNYNQHLKGSQTHLRVKQYEDKLLLNGYCVVIIVICERVNRLFVNVYVHLSQFL